MRNYLILDFGASLLHTHHSRVIRGYAELMLNLGQKVDIFLPMCSEINLDFPNARVIKKLLPSYHPVAFNASRLRTWIPGLIGVLYRLTENTWFHKISSKLLIELSIYLAYLRVKKYRPSASDLTIIFPTACPVSLRLGYKLERKKISSTLVYRLTNTAERRGYHAKFLSLEKTLDRLTSTTFIESRFGFEMIEYGRTLPIPTGSLFLSPTPPCHEVLVRNLVDSNLTLGFLGMAQKHKGISWMTELVKTTLDNQQERSICWVIQTEEQPPTELLTIARRLPIKLLPGRLSEYDLTVAFSEVDVVCLPYDANTYKFNASALAYRAADNFTAVATFRGSAFAREIEEFGIGIVAEDLHELCELMSNFDTGSLHENIRNYNQMRKTKNLIFIGLIQ